MRRWKNKPFQELTREEALEALEFSCDEIERLRAVLDIGPSQEGISHIDISPLVAPFVAAWYVLVVIPARWIRSLK